MKILNIGSLNIDDVYRVDHFVKPGESQICMSYEQYCGGKGLNQSIALVRAGGEVFHAGKIGADGIFLKEQLDSAGVNTDYVFLTGEPSGKAVIQVDSRGENSIIVYSGANRTFDTDDVKQILSGFGDGDILLLQNEINMLNEIITSAGESGMTIAFNPAPMDKNVKFLPLHRVDLFIVNEIEGEELTGENDPETIISVMGEMFPEAGIFLTLGEKGVLFREKDRTISYPAEKVTAIDSTAAGDTFTGYLLTGLSEGMSTEEAVKLAVKASALTVTKKGASNSIPVREELVF